MADSKIEWTQKTWNPVTGCSNAGPGCYNCYARAFAERWRGVVMPSGKPHAYHQGFDVKEHPDRLYQPLQWKRPARIFVNSMSDLFHKKISREFLDRIFAVMEKADHHEFQILTKRSSPMMRYVNRRYPDGVPRQMWLGVTVENKAARSRIGHLRSIRCERRFISFEPLLESVAGRGLDLAGIHWAIVGGESGPKARDFRGEWAREIRAECRRRGTAFFFKQWGGRHKRLTGRTLDGREWDEYPASLDGRLPFGDELDVQMTGGRLR